MIPDARTRPVSPSPATAQGALSISGLHKSFVIGGAPRPVLEGIKLQVKPGEFVSIVGAPFFLWLVLHIRNRAG